MQQLSSLLLLDVSTKTYQKCHPSCKKCSGVADNQFTKCYTADESNTVATINADNE